MPKSESYAATVLSALLGSGSPGSLYIGLYTSAPNSDGTGGTEVAGGSYARKAVTNDATNFPAPVGRTVANGLSIDFVVPTANWGTVVAVGIFAALSGGVPMYFGNLVAARTINNGDAFGFAVSQLAVTEN